MALSLLILDKNSDQQSARPGAERGRSAAEKRWKTEWPQMNADKRKRLRKG
jgi:hypothetical protein